MSNYFDSFRTGTLFLIRTPETFPVGYAEKSIADMKHLHLDYIAWLETWNCMDGIVWKHPNYPRSSFWKDEERDPLEEVFEAADRHNMVFMPEAGVMHESFVAAHPEGMIINYDGTPGGRYGRLGLVPAAPYTADYFIAKYDAMLDKFGSHPSCRGICMPCENGIAPTFDRFTQDLWRKQFSCPMPSLKEAAANRSLEIKLYGFWEECFLEMYRKLARHLKQKYRLPLMHYPVSIISYTSHMCQRGLEIYPAHNLSMMNKVEEIDLMNIQLHPPLSNNIFHFKLESEILQGLRGKLPNMADTHFYHETCAGKLPDATPKRYIDYVLSTLSPFGISFFSYGFFAPELPLWKNEINPGAKVFNGYAAPEIVARRRESVTKALEMTESLRPLLKGVLHFAETAIYWNENFESDYLYRSYYRDHLFGLYELCQSVHLPVCIAAEIPTNTDKIKLLIFHSVKSFSSEESKNLTEFLKNGGKVLVIGDCCQEIQHICNLEISRTEAVYVKSPESDNYHNVGFAPPANSYKFTEKNGTTLMSYDTGTPAITRNSKVLYFGAAGAISTFSDVRDLRLADIWRNLVKSMDGFSGVNIKAPYLTFEDGHTFLSADLFETPNHKRKLLFLRNFGVEINNLSVDWQLPSDCIINKIIVDGVQTENECKLDKLPEFEHFIIIQAEAKPE